MQKRFLVFSFFFACFFKEADAQTYLYKPFPTGYAFWVNAEGYPPNLNNVNYTIMNGDSVIYGKVYHKMYVAQSDTNNSPFLTYYLREELNKIYLLSYNFQIGPHPEFVVYDFGLNQLDTFPMICGSINDTVDLIVTQIDTIATLVDLRVRYKLVSANASYPLYWFQDNDHYWIEGIGSNFGLFSDLTCPFFNETPYHQLLCFWHNGQYILQSNFGCFFTSVAEIEDERFVVSVFPNPTTDVVRIASPAFLNKRLKLSVHDLQGCTVYQSNASNYLEQRIYVSGLPSASYLLTLSDETGKVFSTFFQKL